MQLSKLCFPSDHHTDSVSIVYGVVSYIRSQLVMESNIMNRRFAQQNSPRVLEARKKNYLIETEGDPRKTLYNVLNWS